MSSAANGDPLFQLEFSGKIAQALRRLQRQASREGRGKAFLLALRQAVEQLRKHATEFGEPLYRLPALRMEVRCAMIRPLGIHFAVCDDRSLVFIKAVKLLSEPGS